MHVLDLAFELLIAVAYFGPPTLVVPVDFVMRVDVDHVHYDLVALPDDEDLAPVFLVDFERGLDGGLFLGVASPSRAAADQDDGNVVRCGLRHGPPSFRFADSRCQTT